MLFWTNQSTSRKNSFFVKLVSRAVESIAFLLKAFSLSLEMSIPGITSGSAGNGSGTAPLLGSKVSLISQAEIRYEGILYTVDPAEKTIALAKGFFNLL